MRRRRPSDASSGVPEPGAPVPPDRRGAPRGGRAGSGTGAPQPLPAAPGAASPRSRPTRAGGRRPRPGGGGLTAPGAFVVLTAVALLGGVLNELLTNTLGTLFGTVFLAVCVLVALKTRPRDLVAAVVAPPIAFALTAVATSVLFPSDKGEDFLLRTGLDVFTALTFKAGILFAGTALAAAVVLVRKRAARDGESSPGPRNTRDPRDRNRPERPDRSAPDRRDPRSPRPTTREDPRDPRTPRDARPPRPPQSPPPAVEMPRAPESETPHRPRENPREP